MLYIFDKTFIYTVFAEINAPPPKLAPTKNSDFSKGGVHKTDGL